jgi:radical SAM protein (TIGR01212 family)
MEKGWRGLPYNTISNFYHQRFGEKIYKIPVSVVDDCPNRRGLKGMQTCVFCDVWGSAARSESMTMTLPDQISQFGELLGKRFKAKNFLVYFQAYTNTFTKLSFLRANFETALDFPFVKGFVVGTRPDCLSPAVMALWQEFHEKSFVSVELGVQSFFDDQLRFLRRGHTSQQSLDAIEKIAQNTTADLGIHLMFGQPGETDDHMIETARLVNGLPIQNIKLHNLHVLKNTPLAEMYAAGEFSPIDRETYARRVQIFIEHLSPRFHLHRLAALASRWDELIAPDWTKDKMGTHQYIIDHLRAHGSYQSRQYLALNPQELSLQNQFFQNSQPLFAPSAQF